MVFKSKASVKSHDSNEPELAKKTQQTNPRTSGRKRSPARTKSPTRPKSPGRPKSPARSKSPARKNVAKQKNEPTVSPATSTSKIVSPKARSPLRRSPGRKSPTRVTKVTNTSVETVVTEKRRIQRPTRYYEVDSDSDFQEVLPEKPQAVIRGRARNLEVHVEKMDLTNAESPNESVSNVAKRITRSSQNRELERVVHLKHFDTVAKKIGEFSDEDDLVRKKSESVERSANFKQISEFGGWLGALFFTLLLPSGILMLYIFCNENQCSFTKVPNFTKYLMLSTYFHLTSFLGFITYATSLALLSVIPLGGKVVTGLPTKQGRFVYIMNGLFSFVFIIAITGVLEFQGISVSVFLTQHLFQLLISSILFGFLISTYAYMRSFYIPFSGLNAHVLGKSGVYGFFMGRELSPRVFGLLDLKMYVLRLSLIGCILLDFALLYKSLTSGTIGFPWYGLNFNPTLIVLVTIHSLYFFDGLMRESAWVTSFEIQYEGFGYMSGMGYLIYPFMIASTSKYVIDYNVQLAGWKLALISVVFLLGLILFCGSNNQKDAFRKNPYDPALSHLETIPTTKGKKLICSGFWGIVRHPNYLGDILMNLSFLPFVALVPPVLTVWAIVILLVHRSLRDNARCKQKYGSAWDRYCAKVKYILVPKVF